MSSKKKKDERKIVPDSASPEIHKAVGDYLARRTREQIEAATLQQVPVFAQQMRNDIDQDRQYRPFRELFGFPASIEQIPGPRLEFFERTVGRSKILELRGRPDDQDIIMSYNNRQLVRIVPETLRDMGYRIIYDCIMSTGRLSLPRCDYMAEQCKRVIDGMQVRQAVLYEFSLYPWDNSLESYMRASPSVVKDYLEPPQHFNARTVSPGINQYISATINTSDGWVTFGPGNISAVTAGSEIIEPAPPPKPEPKRRFQAIELDDDPPQ